MIDEKEIISILMKPNTPQRAVEEMVRRAIDNGGKDNITVIVCAVL